MSPEETLVVIAYQDDSAALAAQERLLVLRAENLVELEIAALAIKDVSGKVSIHRRHRGLRHVFDRSGDSSGLDDESVQASARALDPGQAALYLLVRSVSPEKVVPELSRYGGTLLATSLPADREQLLKEALAQQFTAEQISARLTH